MKNIVCVCYVFCEELCFPVRILCLDIMVISNSNNNLLHCFQCLMGKYKPVILMLMYKNAPVPLCLEHFFVNIYAFSLGMQLYFSCLPYTGMI